jgi:hypothetical protein
MRAVGKKIHQPLALIFGWLLCTSIAFAQSATPRPTPPPPPPPGAIDGNARPSDAPPLTTFEEELRAKHAIKMAEKEHQENLDRAQEIAQIGKELQESLKNQSNIDRDYLKKIDRLEKLTKKVRGEAGGEDEEVEIANRPSDLASTVCKVAEGAQSLSKNVRKTPRQVVSASVIDDANVLLQLIKLLRTFVR